MEHSGKRRNRVAGPGSVLAERTNPMERLGLFLDDHPGAATPLLFGTKDKGRAKN